MSGYYSSSYYTSGYYGSRYHHAVSGIAGDLAGTLEGCDSATEGLVEASITGLLSSTLANTTSLTAGLIAGTVTGTLSATLGGTSSTTTGVLHITISGSFTATLGGINSYSDNLELPMSTRIESILTRARDTLADPKKERWSDDRLLRLLDEAQQDVAKQSKLLKGTYDLSLVIGQAEYTLPDDIWLIVRATFDDYEIPLKSYDTMGEQARKSELSRSSSYGAERTLGYSVDLDSSYRRFNWKVLEGSTMESLIFDNRNLQSIRVYPIPDAAIAQSAYTFENAGTVEYVGDELLGVSTSITDYTQNSVYGVITSLYEPAIETEIFDSVYGVVTGATESEVVVKIWYIKTPTALATLADDLELPRMFDVALKHYVVGHALRDDIDTQYREMGAESLALYERELQIARSTSSTNATKNAVNHTSTYRGGFE